MKNRTISEAFPIMQEIHSIDQSLEQINEFVKSISDMNDNEIIPVIFNMQEKNIQENLSNDTYTGFIDMMNIINYDGLRLKGMNHHQKNKPTNQLTKGLTVTTTPTIVLGMIGVVVGYFRSERIVLVNKLNTILKNEYQNNQEEHLQQNGGVAQDNNR